MSFQNIAHPRNPTKAPGSPDEYEPFDPYPDKSPITDEPPEEEPSEEPGKKYSPDKRAPSPEPGESPALPDAPENPTN